MSSQGAGDRVRILRFLSVVVPGLIMLASGVAAAFVAHQIYTPVNAENVAARLHRGCRLIAVLEEHFDFDRHENTPACGCTVETFLDDRGTCICSLTDRGCASSSDHSGPPCLVTRQTAPDGWARRGDIGIRGLRCDVPANRQATVRPSSAIVSVGPRDAVVRTGEAFGLSDQTA